MISTSQQNKTDCTLTAILQDRIRWDKRVSLADLDIVVRSGLVIVSGYVDTSFKKNAALEIISQTEGVWRLEDRIVVPGDYYRTDEEIATILERQIQEFVKIGGEHIEVEVLDGVVRLEGEVFRPRLKALAVTNAWELSGVKDVVNYIEIRYPPQKSSISLNENVVTGFFREESVAFLED